MISTTNSNIPSFEGPEDDFEPLAIVTFVARNWKLIVTIFVIVVVSIVLFVIFSILNSMANAQREEENILFQSVIAQAQETVNKSINVYDFDEGDILPQRKVVIDNAEYTLPLIQNISPREYLALTIIKLTEFGALPETECSNSDQSSVGGYQQLATEMAFDPAVKADTQELLGNDLYNSIFHESRLRLMRRFPKKEIRKEIPLTSGYGPRKLKAAGSYFHYGIDFGYSGQMPVSSQFKGKVQYVGFDDDGGGKTIVIYHEKIQRYTLYAHLSAQFVKVGDQIGAGQLIGLSGNTGTSTGEHLHYQMMTSLEGGWNAHTLNINPVENPDKPELYDMQQVPFLALCRQLTSFHLKTAFFDRLALKRLYREPKGRKALDMNLTAANTDEFLYSLCLSQRPDNCLDWTSRAKKIYYKLSL